MVNIQLLELQGLLGEQTVQHRTSDQVLGPSPTSGSMFGGETAYPSAPPPACARSLTLPLSNKGMKS